MNRPLSEALAEAPDQPLHVLAVDDDAVDLEQLRRCLRAVTRLRIELTTAASLKAAQTALDADEFGLLLLDLNLTDSSGIETLQEVIGWGYELPIVVLTGMEDRELGEAAIARGAADYLSKGDLTPQLLEKTILYSRERYALAQQQLQQQRKFTEALLAQQNKISENLHDGVLQQQVAINAQAEALYELLQATDHPQAADAKELLESLSEVRDTLRAAVQGIAPPALKEHGLVGALERLAEQIPQQGGLRCRFEAAPGTSISDERVSLQLYYIAQEAFNNALRHSQASEIVISLASTPRYLVLEVSDDGQGFNLEDLRTSERGRGLGTMYHRSSMIGAHFRVTSQTGRGTTIRCRLPHHRLTA